MWLSTFALLIEGTKKQTKPQQINTFWWEGKTGVPGEKPLRAEKKTNILDPHNSEEDEIGHWSSLMACVSS